MNLAYLPPVPAEEIRQLPTRDVALLLAQYLASVSPPLLQFDGVMGSGAPGVPM